MFTVFLFYHYSIETKKYPTLALARIGYLLVRNITC